MEGFTRLAGRSKAQVSTVKLGADSVNQGLRYKGIFDLNEVYRIIYDWLVSKGFQVQESKYRSIVLPHGAKELSFDWNAHKKRKRICHGSHDDPLSDRGFAGNRGSQRWRKEKARERNPFYSRYSGFGV